MLFRIFFSLLIAVVPATPLMSQSRDFHTGRLVLDDNGGGGTTNSLIISTPADLPGDRTLTIPDPGPSGGEFVLSTSGSINLSEIETPNSNETLRLNPSGDLVRIGNSATPGSSNGLEVYGDVVMNGPTITLSSTGSAGLQMGSQDIAVVGRTIYMNVTENVTINGNLVVNGDLTVGGDMRVMGSGSRIGSGADLEQLRVLGSSAGSANHLYVVGNVRLTNELRIGSTTTNTSIFKTGTQTGQITYTLPTSLPASAGTSSSMGNGIMQTDNTGAMTWRNSGTGSSALDFPSTNDGASSDLTLTVTGAAVGDMVVLGIPNGAQPAGTVWYQGWVSAADTVTVRLYNQSGAAVDPASDTFNVMVLRP